MVKRVLPMVLLITLLAGCSHPSMKRPQLLNLFGRNYSAKQLMDFSAWLNSSSKDGPAYQLKNAEFIKEINLRITKNFLMTKYRKMAGPA